jgi:hypothetical protein
LSIHETLLKTKFCEYQAISVYKINEFQSEDVWREMEIQDFHKTNTTDGKLASIRENNCTYSKRALCITSNMSSKRVSLSAGTFNQ